MDSCCSGQLKSPKGRDLFSHRPQQLQIYALDLSIPLSAKESSCDARRRASLRTAQPAAIVPFVTPTRRSLALSRLVTISRGHVVLAPRDACREGFQTATTQPPPTPAQNALYERIQSLCEKLPGVPVNDLHHASRHPTGDAAEALRDVRRPKRCSKGKMTGQADGPPDVDLDRSDLTRSQVSPFPSPRSPMS